MRQFQNADAAYFEQPLQRCRRGRDDRVAVAGLGAHSKPREAFNWMLLAFAVSQFLELQLIPHLSMNGIYVFFIATYVVTLPFVRLIPKTSPPVQSAAATQPAEKDNEARPTLLAWVGIAAIVIAYINIGAYWSNIELAAEAAGLDGGWAAQVKIGRAHV